VTWARRRDVDARACFSGTRRVIVDKVRILSSPVGRLFSGYSVDKALDLLFDLNPRLSTELTADLLIRLIHRLAADSKQTVGPALARCRCCL
jgi:hypothetical protein